ncbi:MAG: WD40/YVTN/BNR-like repeat-containing protein [Bacteroidota bacterium]
MFPKKAIISAFFLQIFFLGQAQEVDMDIFHGMKPRNIGPAGMSGRVTAIAVDQNKTNVFYVGTASGGLWKTTSGGIKFEPVFDKEEVASIGALAIDPQRPDIIWAGTGEGNPRNSITGGFGLYKSLDAGMTWDLAGLENTRHIHRILVNPDNSNIVYAGAIGSPWLPNKERGLYKTTDGGKTWKQILYTNETSGVAEMVMDPENPDKIIVAMWDHQRWPWFFTSGGEGSGLYITLDGGESFKKITEGLPEKLGRIGLAIAKSRPEYVYAYVESETNAIYRSTDGGFTWEKRGSENIGTRPFYYAEIYVDPTNENRIYTLYSRINVSEDGGLTFPTEIAETVHLDHHAWWINPEDPKHMIDGNDGGLAITYDMGKSWRHITNMPVGQFYHISVDMEKPYHVYGGLQDNGSWRGPAYTWTNGGIINEYWDFLIGGDGFDALPVPGDPRYCYAQSQGGALRRIDIETGEGTSIRPSGEGDERLRFNWNSALAQDPFDNNTIYFGSQFVHKSTNRGDSWETISPDLTTNDPEKQKQRQSGGLTIDATGAENHCTLLAIEPGPVKKGLIWAGSDDGKLHITTDGGENWKEVGQNIKDMPPNAWIPQITASEHNEGEAFVVVNNYRLGDYKPYLFRTTDYGKSWDRIIGDNDVWAYVLCFVQDPVEANLMFAGTEYGLYVSFDGADTWNKWTVDYPTVSTYDMAIQRRENDLVIGTFGRSIWIIDDIVPLREMARTETAILEEELVLFEPPVTTMAETKNLPGYYFRADAMFEGDNKPVAAMISFYSAREADDDKINLYVLNNDGDTLRKMEIEYDKGFNRILWDHTMDPPEMPGMIRNEEGGGRRNFFRYRRGAKVLPGKYKLVLCKNDISSSSEITVNNDPRMPEPDIEAIKKNRSRAFDLQTQVIAYNEKYKDFRDIRNNLAKMNELITEDMDFADEHKEIYDSVNKEYNSIMRSLTNRREGLSRDMFGISVLYTATSALTEAEEESVNKAVEAMNKAEEMIETFIGEHWTRYVNFFKENNITLDKILR